MKVIATIALSLMLSVTAVAESRVCPRLTDVRGELKETRALVARMQSRIVAMRNSAGTIREFETRNALQVNADGWQDLVDMLKLRIGHMQNVVDRCEAREKIEGAKSK